MGLKRVTVAALQTPRLAGFLLSFLLCVTAWPALPQSNDRLTASQAPLWFSVDSLPERALEPPDGIDLSSPRATARSFFDAADAGRFDAAAATLQTVEGTEADPPRLAHMLYEVFERRLWLSDDSLSSRDDGAMEPQQSGAAPVARRSVDFGSMDLGRFPVTIRLSRFRTEQGDTVWLFDEATVRAIPRLYERYGPGWLERRLPRWWQQDTGYDIRRWEVVALPLIALGCWLAGWLIAAGLRRVERLIKAPWLRMGAAKARLPLALMAAALIARIALGSPLGFSAIVTLIADPVLVGLVTLALLLAVLRVMDAGLDMVTRRYVGEIDDKHSRDERQFYTSMYGLRRLVTLLAVLGGTGAVLLELDVFAKLGYSLLASAGVLTVTLGFAAQTVIGNILASLQIAIAKPVRIGDSILYEGRWAYVEAIYYTFIRLRTWDEKRLIVPVQYFISNPFENWSMTDAKMIETLTVVLDHAADVSAVRSHFHALVQEDEEAMRSAPHALQVVDHDAAGIHLRCYATAADPTTAWTLHVRLREKLLAWIGRQHPEWWPRERIGETAGSASEPWKASAAR
jgi:small-conductance mechanosensitive channel